MNIYYSEVTLLLESFILFEPIYKNIYLTITKLGRVQSLYSFFDVFRGKKAAGFQSTGLH